MSKWIATLFTVYEYGGPPVATATTKELAAQIVDEHNQHAALLAEVTRLRAIEQAARAVHERAYHYVGFDSVNVELQLWAALSQALEDRGQERFEADRIE